MYREMKRRDSRNWEPKKAPQQTHFKFMGNGARSAWIKSQLILNGITQADIARGLGLTAGQVSAVIGGYGRGRAVKKAVASALGIDYFALWIEEKVSPAA